MPIRNRGDRHAESKAYYAKNRERILAANKAWAKSKPQNVKAAAFKSSQKYADKNRRVRDPKKAAEHSRRWRLAHPGRVKEVMRRHDLKRKFNLTPDDVVRMTAEQNDACAICGQANNMPRALCIDHDHETGAIRGLLCVNCNSMLGHAFDSPVRLMAAIDYLVKHGSPGVLEAAA